VLTWQLLWTDFVVLSHGPVPHLQHRTAASGCHRRLEWAR